MKKLSKIGACAILAAGVVTSAFGQVQYAGNNQVNLDFTGLPVGPVVDVANTGMAGGVFEAYTNNMTANPHSLGPQVIALGGSGTHGALFDVNYCLRHLASAGGAAQYAPAGIVGTSPNFSVEAWIYAATIPDDNPVVSWGTRGNCSTNQVACSYGSDASWGAMPMWCADSGWGSGGAPVAGQWHHLVWTFAAGGTEQLYVDGASKVSYTGKGAALDANNNILIGASHATTAGSMSGAVYGGSYVVGRVRIDDGVLTLAQVANNYAYEAPSFTNGVPAFLSALPLHRWSFTNAAGTATGATVADIGTATGSGKINGIVRNNGGTATFTGSALSLSGGSSATAPYVDLTNSVISALSTNKLGSGQVTIEAWVTPAGAGSWAPLFDFGSNTVGKVTAPGGSFNGVNYIGLVCTPGGNQNQSAIGFQTANYTFNSVVTGKPMHMALTWDDTTNTGIMTMYENGIEVAQCTTANRFIGISDINNWIGRSAWSGDANLQGTLSEFRIFNRIVTPAEILNDYQVGPTVTGPLQKWNGNISGNWDINSTANWLTGASHVTYNDANGPVQFDDTLTGTPLVNVTTTVQPSTLTVNNTYSNYVFSGSGSISGSVGLTKNGNGTLTINNLNNYTGITALNAGTLIVTNLANGGAPSALGAASAAPVNIALTGGTLSYQGPATSINRGYTAGAATLDVENNLAISGQIAASGGNFTKEGPAPLTYNGAAINQLSAGDYYVGNGTVILDGTAGQTNTISGQTYIGFDQAHGASMIISNTVLTGGNWFCVARGNGTGGYTSTADIYNSLCSVNQLSMGYANGIVGNNQTGVLTLHGNSQFSNTGGSFNLSESGGSTCTINVLDNSWMYSASRILLGMSSGATGNLVVANNGAVTNNAWTSIGVPGGGNMTLRDNAVYNNTASDFNVTDTAGTAANPSIGILNISNNATLNLLTLYVGKSTNCTGTINQGGGTVNRISGGDWRIGGNQNLGATWAPLQVGIWNLSGGTINCAANFQAGAYGTGIFNQSGGTVNLTGGYPSIGRFSGGTGTLNVSGGNFNQLTSGTILIIGEEGTGTLNVSGTGAVNCMNRLGVGWHDTAYGTGTVNLTNGVISATNNVTIGGGGTGTVNLYGGTLATSQVISTGGTGTLNFYGGTLQAMPGANANFMSGLTQVNIYGAPSAGAVIDTGANAITINQNFYDGDSSDNLIKIGSGTLTLGYNLYNSGINKVSQGTLVIPAAGYSIYGSLAAADGATLDIQIASPGNQVSPANVTLGTLYGSTLQFDLGTFGVPIAPPLVASGTLQLTGTNVINVIGSGLTSQTDIPLVQYGALAGSGSVVLGTLPPGVSGYIFTNTVNSPNTIDLYVQSVNILVWSGATDINWDFNVGTDFNWTNILNSTSALYTQGSSVVFDDTAVTPVVNLTTTNSPSSITFSNSTLSYVLQGNGKIAGTTGMTLAGTAGVTLNITNSTYTGPTVINGGSLTAGFPSALSPNSAVTVDNALLELNSYNQAATTVAADNATIDGTSAATLTGTGFTLEATVVNANLGGSGSLNAVGTSAELVTVANNNSYTGKTVVSGGTLNVTNLQNSGYPSSIGASSASPTNLVLAGGTLSYQGTGASIDRGYTVTANSTLDTEGNLTMGGQVKATGGTFFKAGPASLTLSGAGNNTLAGAGVSVGNGLLIIGGTARSTNYVAGQTWVGYDQAHSASLILTNTTMTNSDWFAVGRGNGAGGYISTADLYNSSYTAANVSFGYANGVAGNSQNVVVTLHGNSQLIDNGGTGFNLTESSGSISALVISNTSSVYSLNRFLTGMSLNSTGSVLVADSGTLTVAGGWFDVGNGGSGNLTLQDNSILQTLTDFNVTDSPGSAAAPSTGTVNILGNAQLIIDTLYVGKAYGNPIGIGYCTGIVNQSGGTVVGTTGGDWRIGGNNTTNTSGLDSTLFGTYNLSGGVVSSPSNLQLGGGGTGEWEQTGGTVWVAAYPSVGRWPNSYGQMDISAGSFNQTNIATFMLVGESGTGMLTITNAGLISAVGGLDIGGNATGVGTVNLGGGTLSVTHVFRGSGTGTLNLNGGLLQAMPGSFLNFMSGLTAANVLAGGANIDSGANSINISQPLLNGGGSGGLNKYGTGSLVLDGVNTYTGATVVNAGTLGGVGTIAGNVTVNSSATLQPGDTGSGTLTVNGNITLSGGSTALFSVNGSAPANTSVAAGGAVNYGGTLSIMPSGVFTAGQTFTLFSGSGAANPGNFTSISGSPGAGLAYTFTNGVLSVVATVNTAPTNITATVTGNTLALSWPADHTGWRLLVQTNNLGAGVSANTNDWTTVPGSSSINQTNITIDPTKSAEFYRLVYP